MHVWYILSFLGMDELRGLAKIMAVPELPDRKTDAAVLLAEQMRTAEGFARVYGTLCESERRWLEVFMFAMETDGYVLFLQKQQVYSWFQQQPTLRHEADAVLSKLQKIGFFGKSHNWYAGDSLECADELLPFLYPMLLKEMAVSLPVTKGSDAATVTWFGSTFAHDITRFLSLLAKRQVGFTKNNILYKREIPKVLPYFRSAKTSGLLATGAWEDVPGVIVIAIRYLLSHNLLKLDEGKAILQGQPLEEWLRQDQEQLRESMLAITLQATKDTPSHIGGVLIEWLRTGQPGDQIFLQQMFARWAQLPLPDVLLRGWEQKVWVLISIATLTGIVDRVEDKASGMAVRIAAWRTVATQSSVVVQPNLEMLVSEDTQLPVHFLAGQLGDLEQADVMTTYHLNKERVLQLCDRGWSYEDVEKALTTISHQPVQPSVLRTVRDWMASYNRAVFWDAMLIRFEQPEWQQAFMRDKRAAAIIVEELGGIAVIIKRSGEKAAREILDDIGAPAPLRVRKPQAEGATMGVSGVKISKANAEALNRLTSVKMIDLFGMN